VFFHQHQVADQGMDADQREQASKVQTWDLAIPRYIQYSTPTRPATCRHSAI